MPLNIYKREADNRVGDSITGLMQGFLQGQELKRKRQEQELANLLTGAKIGELTRKSEALSQPAPEGYLRDPYSGKLYEDLKYTNSLMPGMGGGGEGQPLMPGGQPFVRVGRKTMANPNYLDPLEQLKADALRKKQEEEQQQQLNREEMLQSSAEDMLNTVGEVRKGLHYFGPMGNVPTYAAPSTIKSLGKDYGPRKNWEVNVNKLLSGKIVDLMSQMKAASKTGATGFGALSQKELAVLQEASTALKKDLSPDDASRYLNEIERMQRKILSGKKGVMPTGNPVENNSLMPKKSKYEVVSVD